MRSILKTAFLLSALLFANCISAQTAVVQDSATNRNTALRMINELRKGFLVVKLKFNERSIEAYRNSGKKKIAERLEAEQRKLNLEILQGFRKMFSFCPVYFIKASDCTRFAKGEKVMFLDDSLRPSPAISAPDSFFVFAEFGTLMENERIDENSYKGVKTTKEGSTPVSYTAIFMTDREHRQLREPFPFKVIIRFNMLDKGIERLNKHLENFDYKFGEE
jgi:hypothetical protein